MHKIFGLKENADYLDREGVYLIPFRNHQVGVIRTTRGYFLIGGGLEAGEDHWACIERECMEETGCFPVVKEKVCSAEMYCRHPEIGYFHPIQTYYLGQLQEKQSITTEKDHVLCWINYKKLEGRMFLEMQNWALEQASARMFCK